MFKWLLHRAIGRFERRWEYDARYLHEMVDPAVVRAVLAQTPSLMPPHVALAWRFTRATLDHDPRADEYREEIARLWGPRAVVTLAFAIVTSRMYPTVKYAMGHGKACTRIVVDGAPIPIDPPPLAARRA